MGRVSAQLVHPVTTHGGATLSFPRAKAHELAVETLAVHAKPDAATVIMMIRMPTDLDAEGTTRAASD
jgi:hypothetical protein